jgi:hypothetical protein
MRPYSPFLPFRSQPSRVVATLGAVALLALDLAAGHATTLHTRDEIPALAFAEADSVEVRNMFLTADQRTQIEALAGSALESELVTIYEGRRDGRVIGFAVLDSHVVRTLSEALLIVLDTSGQVTSTYVMAFHEPSEYMPSRRWLGLLEQRELSRDLRVGRGIVGITGATLSARAVVAAVRRVLAIHAVVLAEN